MNFIQFALAPVERILYCSSDLIVILAGAHIRPDLNALLVGRATSRSASFYAAVTPSSAIPLHFRHFELS